MLNPSHWRCQFATQWLTLALVVVSFTACTIPRRLSPPPPANAPFQASQEPATARQQPSSVSQVAYQRPAKSKVEPMPPIQSAEPAPPVLAPPAVLPLPTPDPNASDQGTPTQLRLEELEQMAFANNPSIAEASAKVGAARGKWVQAGLCPNPRLGYSGQQVGSGGEAEQHGVYLEQDWIRGGKLKLHRAVVSREIRHAEQQLAAQRLRVQTDVRTGFYDVLCAQRRLELAGALVRIGDRATTVAEQLLKNQEGTRRDVLQARIESQIARNLLQQAQNQHLSAWRRLAAVLGTPSMPPMQLDGKLDEPVTEYNWEQALQRLLSESPELSAAFAEIDRARWAVERAQVQAVPDVNFQGIVQHDNSTGAANGAVLVSVPIPVLNRNQGGIREAQSELVAAQRAAERTELGLQRRLAAVFEEYLTSRTRVDNYRNGILRDAQEGLDLTRQGYEAGELSFLNLLMAQRTYSQANLNYLEALRGMWTASARIEGLLLMDSLEAGEAFSVPEPVNSPAGSQELPNMAGQL